MTQSDRLHGGLIFADGLDQGLDGVCRIVSSTLQDYGYVVDRQSLMPGGQARVTTARISVGLELLTHEDGRRRLALQMITAGHLQVDPEEGQLVLLVMLYRIAEATDVEEIEWLDPDTLVPAGRFLGVFNKVSPRRVQSRPHVVDMDTPRFAPVAEEEDTICGRYDELNKDRAPTPKPDLIDQQEAVAHAFRRGAGEDPLADADAEDETPDSDIRRLATWGMTGVVVCLSAPVGASMAAVNLLRGEDFRLNTQVLALTGFLGVATSTSAMAQVVSYLPV